MAKLPEKKFDQFDFDFEREHESLKQPTTRDNGLHIMNNGPISIDNVQGLLTIDQQNGPHKLLLNNVEDGVLYINAPHSDVILTLKGLHDSSYINCRNL
jgi:hypothetical protein